MCQCKNITFGSKECEKQKVILPTPKQWNCSKEAICIDPCVVDEIKILWQYGVRTYGCCCGHNITESMVNVDDKDIDFMIKLGYVQNHIDKTRKDTFRLRTV